MIKQTFYNLPEGKKNRILDAIKKEFDKVPIDKISINSIIKEANISRGSFYQYFDDKGDLYDIIADKMSEKIKEILWEYLARNKGDIFATCYDLIHNKLCVDNIGDNVKHFRKFMPNVSINAKSIVERIWHNMGDNIKTIVSNIDTSKLNISEEYDIRILIFMLMNVVKETYFDRYMLNRSNDWVLMKADKMIAIIKNGCLKEEYR